MAKHGARPTCQHCGTRYGRFGDTACPNCDRSNPPPTFAQAADELDRMNRFRDELR